MSRASRDRMGSRTPKITPEDMTQDVEIATIAGYEEDEIDDPEAPEGKRLLAKVFFEETGEKALFLNATMMDDLIEGFGTDETDNWVGKKVPLEVRKTKFRGKTYNKVYVVSHEDWAKFLKPPCTASKRTTKRSRR